MDGEKVRAGRVAAANYEVSADVALVAEKMLLEHGHAGDDAGFAVGGEGVEFEVGGGECGGEFGVCGCTGAGTPDFGGYVMKFFAVLEWEEV